MNFVHRTQNGSFSSEALCTRILERHRDTIRVQKPHLAVANLTRIIDATLKLSNRQGFHATSLRDLSKESGLSMGGLYSYFENKASLLSMILIEVSETVNEVLNAAPEEVVGDPKLHLAWLVDAHIRLTEVMQPWFTFAFMEAKAFPARERRIAIESELLTENIFASVLREGVENGSFFVSDVEMTASLVKPLLQDWYVKRAKYRKRSVGIDRYIDYVTKFIYNSISVNHRD